MRIWTDSFLPTEPWVVSGGAVNHLRRNQLINRRDELCRHEERSYAALGRRIVTALVRNGGYAVVVADGRNALGFMAKGVNVVMIP